MLGDAYPVHSMGQRQHVVIPTYAPHQRRQLAGAARRLNLNAVDLPSQGLLCRIMWMVDHFKRDMLLIRAAYVQKGGVWRTKGGLV